MLDAAMAVLGSVLLLLGLALATVGLYGMLRKPDIFEQLHAAGLVSGPGVILVLLAAVASARAEILTSAALVIAFILVTSSLSTHAIALAAWRRRATASDVAEGRRRDAEAGPSFAAAGPGRPAPARVLVAHDGSPDAGVAVRLAATLALPRGCAVRLIAVVEGDLEPLSREAEPGADRAGDAPDRVAAALEAARGLLDRPGISVDQVLRRGQPASAIVDEALAMDAELVVVGTRGLSRVRAILEGSVGEEVVDRSPCPVLVAQSQGFGKVLLATDGSEASEAATEVVATWSIFDDAVVRVLSVATALPQYHGGPASTAVREAAETGRHQRVADQAASRLLGAGRRASAHVRAGDAAAQVLAMAESEAVDVIVLGTRGRTGLVRALLGSVAREVLSAAETSVLVVGPTRAG